MKFHETHYEDYIKKVESYNIHPELVPFCEKIPQNVNEFRNLILYGPSGVGKYSQALHFIKNYSPSQLKYEKKMILQNDKGDFIYKISDIHYEIDMALLGCNSKLIWHDIFGQIVDIVTMKKEKIGIIICKNFHEIHSELLEIFYSYMQQYNHTNLSIQLRFILLTNHLSFLPLNIMNHCHVVNVKRPSKDSYKALGLKMNVDKQNILNLKELHILNRAKKLDDVPEDIFDIVCEDFIEQINQPNMKYSNFREALYNILIYNLDTHEMLWSVLYQYIDRLSEESIHKILGKMHNALKQYNNNYRPIYHLENIFLTIVNEIHT
jgi:DNA polymerase III delta prime subunit